MNDPNISVKGSVASSEHLRVLLPEGTNAESVSSFKSLHTDITVPSSRIVITDTSHKSRQYLTVFTKRDDISAPCIERTKDGIKISYKQGEETISFLWSFSNSLKRL